MVVQARRSNASITNEVEAKAMNVPSCNHSEVSMLSTYICGFPDVGNCRPRQGMTVVSVAACMFESQALVVYLLGPISDDEVQPHSLSKH